MNVASGAAGTPRAEDGGVDEYSKLHGHDCGMRHRKNKWP
jgi:hypothetical protein